MAGSGTQRVLMRRAPNLISRSTRRPLSFMFRPPKRLTSSEQSNTAKPRQHHCELSIPILLASDDGAKQSVISPLVHAPRPRPVLSESTFCLLLASPASAQCILTLACIDDPIAAAAAEPKVAQEKNRDTPSARWATEPLPPGPKPAWRPHSRKVLVNGFSAQTELPAPHSVVDAGGLLTGPRIAPFPATRTAALQDAFPSPAPHVDPSAMLCLNVPGGSFRSEPHAPSSHAASTEKRNELSISVDA